MKRSMNNTLNTAAQNFNALTLRERFLSVFTIVVSIFIVWWFFYVEATQLETKNLVQENNRINSEIATSRSTIHQIRRKIGDGVNVNKARKLAQLELALESLEERLRLKTVELIDPDQMFHLMTSLVYKESRLKLLSLKRLAVKPAIAPTAEQGDIAGIYRHVLEVRFSGKFLDILKYMQSLENLEWKLIWDEIEVATNEFPLITVKVVISTLSTRKEWVGV
jgi:MSHA biogenesis protein MshJ